MGKGVHGWWGGDGSLNGVREKTLNKAKSCTTEHMHLYVYLYLYMSIYMYISIIIENTKSVERRVTRCPSRVRNCLGGNREAKSMLHPGAGRHPHIHVYMCMHMSQSLSPSVRQSISQSRNQPFCPLKNTMWRLSRLFLGKVRFVVFWQRIASPICHDQG